VTAQPRSETRRSVHALRHRLAALDYQETITFSFVEERAERLLAGNDDPIRVLNPIAAPLAVMRSSLIGSLVGALRHNLDRKASRVRLFELGRVFRRDASVADGPLTVAGVDQPMRVAALAYGPAAPLQWGERERAADFFDVKGDLEALLAPTTARFVAAEHPALHPGRCAAVQIDGRRVGHVGELHPRWRQEWELPQPAVLFELDLAPLLARPLPAFVPLPRQQSVWRDLSIVVADAVSHERLVQIIAEAGGATVRSSRLYDIYRPAQPGGELKAGERSLTVRVELRDDETTLTDARIDATIASIVAALHERLGARLRG
jgi:phenylalanyl-tRNA synthetase beta chain